MFLLDASHELMLKNTAYRKAVERYVWQNYLADLNGGDVTTEWFVEKPQGIIHAEIIVGEKAVLAGMQEAEWFLAKLGLKIIGAKKDGEKVRPKEVVLHIAGRAGVMLSAERTLLNLLQRMSGVATAANKLAIKMPKNIRLLSTRKTWWGMLDKRAAWLGGAATHRLGLHDAVMVKDNHLLVTKNFSGQWEKLLKKSDKIRFIEIEIDRPEGLEDFVQVFKKLSASSQQKKNLVVMLDNLSPNEAKWAVQKLKKTGVMIEISGGINQKNIHQYCLPGVSAISSGAITNKAPGIDLSMRVV